MSILFAGLKSQIDEAGTPVVYVVMVEQYDCGSLHCAEPDAWFVTREEAVAYAKHLMETVKYKYEPHIYVVDVYEGGE